MSQVFIRKNAGTIEIPIATYELESANYWKEDEERVFLIHISEINYLLTPGGYLGIRVIDIEDPKEVRVQWLSFSIVEEEEYKAKNTNDFFYFLKDVAVTAILNEIQDEENAKVLVFRILKGNNGTIHGFFSAGVLIESGIGTGSPSAGAKVP